MFKTDKNDIFMSREDLRTKVEFTINGNDKRSGYMVDFIGKPVRRVKVEDATLTYQTLKGEHKPVVWDVKIHNVTFLP